MREKKTVIQVLKGGSGKWLEPVLDLVYPARCPFCDDILPFGTKGACIRCRGRVRYVGGSYCMKCGKQLSDETEEYCRDCKGHGHAYDRGRSLYVYDDLIRESIARFKYGGRQEYARHYGIDMVNRLGNFISACRPELMIPVPISKKKLISRGYNQAELVASHISRLTGIPVSDTIITRITDTLPMKELSRTERMKNLKGAFKIGDVDVKCRNVLIVDDIYTTGSTIDAMAALLKGHGVERVYFVTLSSGIII